MQISLPSSLLLSSILLFSHAAHAMQAGHNSDEEEKKYRAVYDRVVAPLNPEQYFALVNSGWVSEYDGLRARLDDHKNYLIIHTLEPSQPMDMRSADKLRKSLEAGGVAQMATVDVGHVWIGWRCQAADGAKPIEGIAGMTGEHSNQFPTMLKEGWGLSTFLAIFTDGHLTPPILAEMDHKAFDGKDPIHTMVVEVEQRVCDQARSFVHDFLTLPSAPYKHFGLAADPRKFEGAGCGTFGVALLQASGLYSGTTVLENFWRKVTASSKLFGYGLPSPKQTAPYKGKPGHSHKVPLLEIALANWNPSAGDPGISLNVMDPELLLLSLKTVYRLSQNELKRADPAFTASFSASPLFKIRGIKASKKATVALPIDANFDAHAKAVVAETERWFAAGGFRPTLFQVDKAPVLLLEKP